MFSVVTIALYCVTLAVLLSYFLSKYKIRRYIVSPYNFNLFRYSFCLFIMPFIFTYDRAWYAVGFRQAEIMKDYLNQCMQVNLIGFTVVLLSLRFFELRYNQADKLVAYIKKMSVPLSNLVLHTAWWALTAIWYWIVFRYNKGLPLLNGGRSFFYRTAISPIYQGIGLILSVYASYYALRFVYFRKDLLCLLITLATMLFTANRGPLISAIGVTVIFYFYHSIQREQSIRYRNLIRQKKQNKMLSAKIDFGGKYLFRFFFLFLLLGISVLLLGVARSRRGHVTISRMVSEMLFGNTFSDIRDGAVILRGYYKKFHGVLLWGKTYLADLLAFIPSRLSPFRSEWSWGRLTAYTLFGYETHFGMRGGNSMEAYLNFGLAGVVMASVVEGYCQALMERIFYFHFISQRSDVSGKEPFALSFFPVILSFSINSQVIASIYPQFLFFLVAIFYSTLLRKK